MESEIEPELAEREQPMLAEAINAIKASRNIVESEKLSNNLNPLFS